MVDLDELQRLAEGAANEADGDWFDPALLELGAPDMTSSMTARRFVHAFDPDTAKKLIAVALKLREHIGALDEATSYVEDGVRSPSLAREHGAAVSALRAALEEVK